MTDETKKEMYLIAVLPAIEGGKVNVIVDGEKSVADGFEFAAPLGSGLQIKKIVRVVLVPPDVDEPEEIRPTNLPAERKW